MSFSFFDRTFYDPRLLDGIDPATGLIPFDPPALPPRSPQLDPTALMALLGNPPPDVPTDPNALMALLGHLAQQRTAAAASGGTPAATSATPASVQFAAIDDNPPPPPGYDPRTWGHSKWDNGTPVLTDPDTKNKYTLHPEDEFHWRHWDIQGPNGEKLGTLPQNRRKPWPNQKRPPYDGQSATDPSGDAPQWQPPVDLFAPLPERLPTMPGARAPMVRFPLVVPP
jgi:hypothetical protein